MKTIARNRVKKIAEIKAAATGVVRYDQSSGNMVSSTIDAALAALTDFTFSKLRDRENGTYVVEVHSNLWYEIDTRPQAAPKPVEKSAADIAEDARRREARNAATLARTVSIHDLGKTGPAATDAPKTCGQRWVAEIGLCTRCGRNAAAHAEENAKPRAEMTLTRKAIGTQIAEALEALGLSYTTGYAGGAGYYEVNGTNYTAGALADLVLEGGFDAAYGRAETVARQDSPLRAADGPTFDEIAEWAVADADEDDDDTDPRERDARIREAADAMRQNQGATTALTVPAGRGRFYVVPAAGSRLTDRHDLLGPYGSYGMAESMAARYRLEGIACTAVESVTRPVLVGDPVGDLSGEIERTPAGADGWTSLPGKGVDADVIATAWDEAHAEQTRRGVAILSQGDELMTRSATATVAGLTRAERRALRAGVTKAAARRALEGLRSRSLVTGGRGDGPLRLTALGAAVKALLKGAAVTA